MTRISRICRDRYRNPSRLPRRRHTRMLRNLFRRSNDLPGATRPPPPLTPLPARIEAVDRAGAVGIWRGLERPTVFHRPSSA